MEGGGWACQMGDRKRGNECIQIQCLPCHARPSITHQTGEGHVQSYDKSAPVFSGCDSGSDGGARMAGLSLLHPAGKGEFLRAARGCVTGDT